MRGGLSPDGRDSSFVPIGPYDIKGLNAISKPKSTSVTFWQMAQTEAQYEHKIGHPQKICLVGPEAVTLGVKSV